MKDMSWEAVAALAAVATIIWAVVVYIRDARLRRFERTYDAFSKIRNEYFELFLRKAGTDNSLTDREMNLRIKKYLSEMERFSVGVNIKAMTYPQ